jgi:hypothetical protein
MIYRIPKGINGRKNDIMDLHLLESSILQITKIIMNIKILTMNTTKLILNTKNLKEDNEQVNLITKNKIMISTKERTTTRDMNVRSFVLNVDFERRESPPLPNYRQYSPPPYEDDERYSRRESPPPYRRNNQQYRRNNYQNDKRRRNYENKKESIVPKGISSKRILKTSGFTFFIFKYSRLEVLSS